MAARKSGRYVYLVDGNRTPFLKAKGKPGPFRASDLAVAAGRQLLGTQPFEPDTFDEVILGCVMPGPDEANIARITALRLGCGELMPAWTVQRNCASGMQALDSAARNIACGRADLILAGGVEAMSHAPVLWSRKMVEWLAAWSRARSMTARVQALASLRPGYLKPVIGLLCGLSDPVVGLSMGQTAENLAYRFNIDRQTMDKFALRSHQRLANAQDNGYLDEIVTLYDTNGNFHDHDDGLRRDSNLQQLSSLRPVFDRHYGSVTAGNSAQITDGACWLILASEAAVNKYELPVLARIVDSEWAGLEPSEMGLGPAHAMTPIMKRHRFSPEDIDYWEINEAFAAQVTACLRAWQDDKYCRKLLHSKMAIGEINEDHLNVDGGSVSLGHPVGASGARIVLHLAKILQRSNSRRGMASLCIGGGQGGAMLLEREAE